MPPTHAFHPNEMIDVLQDLGVNKGLGALTRDSRAHVGNSGRRSCACSVGPSHLRLGCGPLAPPLGARPRVRPRNIRLGSVESPAPLPGQPPIPVRCRASGASPTIAGAKSQPKLTISNDAQARSPDAHEVHHSRLTHQERLIHFKRRGDARSDR